MEIVLIMLLAIAIVLFVIVVGMLVHDMST